MLRQQCLSTFSAALVLDYYYYFFPILFKKSLFSFAVLHGSGWMLNSSSGAIFWLVKISLQNRRYCVFSPEILLVNNYP